jgi:hypothetical protein
LKKPPNQLAFVLNNLTIYDFPSQNNSCDLLRNAARNGLFQRRSEGLMMINKTNGLADEFEKTTPYRNRVSNVVERLPERQPSIPDFHFMI